MGTDGVFRAERIVPHVGVAESHAARAGASATATERASDGPDPIEEIGQRPGNTDGLADRLAAARARWSQLTFYLLDAESWR
jgi:hypothetical protein